MKKLLLIIFLSLSLFANTYKVSQEDSSINFSATKLFFVGVQGNFKRFQGDIEILNNKIVSINGYVDVVSIFTNEEERDTHLKADDYFNAKEYALIKAKSSFIKENKIIFKISIKGIEKEISFKIEQISISKDEVKLILSSQINRQDFMLNGSMSAIINDSVNLKIELLANKI